MPGFQVTVPHMMSQADAVERLKPFTEKLRDHYAGQVKDLKGEWVGNVLNVSFKIMGFDVGAVLTVHDKNATVEGKLPLAAFAFKGQVESAVRDELKKALA